MKKCSKCGEIKPATSEFFPKQTNGMLSLICKCCDSKIRKKRREENKEKISIMGKNIVKQIRRKKQSANIDTTKLIK